MAHTLAVLARGLAVSFSRLLIMFGLVLIAVGLLWPMITKLGLGRLPGDIVIERANLDSTCLLGLHCSSAPCSASSPSLSIASRR